MYISKDKKNLIDGKYTVNIDSKFTNGKMYYGEIFIPGRSKKEILFTTYICHPSMANNEISGQVVNLFLSLKIKSKKRKYSYRFIFVPETIGAISYISKNFSSLKKNLLAGFILTCVGDERAYSYLPSRDGNTLADKISLKILRNTKGKKKYYTWLDRSSDERQFCSPGVDLPVCSLMRSKYVSYKEYHTSLDVLGKVVTSKGLNQSLSFFTKNINEIEKQYIHQKTEKSEHIYDKTKLYHTTKNLIGKLKR